VDYATVLKHCLSEVLMTCAVFSRATHIGRNCCSAK